MCWRGSNVTTRPTDRGKVGHFRGRRRGGITHALCAVAVLRFAGAPAPRFGVTANLEAEQHLWLRLLLVVAELSCLGVDVCGWRVGEANVVGPGSVFSLGPVRRDFTGPHASTRFGVLECEADVANDEQANC